MRGIKRDLKTKVDLCYMMDALLSNLRALLTLIIQGVSKKLYFGGLWAISLKSMNFKSLVMIEYTNAHTFDQFRSNFSNRMGKKRVTKHFFSNKMHFFQNP